WHRPAPREHRHRHPHHHPGQRELLLPSLIDGEKVNKVSDSPIACDMPYGPDYSDLPQRLFVQATRLLKIALDEGQGSQMMDCSEIHRASPPRFHQGNPATRREHGAESITRAKGDPHAL